MKKREKNTYKGMKIKKKRFDFFSFFTVLLAVMVGFECIIGVAGFTTIKSMLQGKPTLDVEELYSQESTRIFDANGNQISDIGEQLRENISYDEIPEALVDAFLSIEDSRYFSHNGFDVARFFAAAVNDIRSGSAAQGGSTFTMQLVKLTYFFTDDGEINYERNIEYKVQQIAVAMELEKKSTKKQIFELYLNKMNFGGSGNIRGVEKASEYYFNKRVSQLNLAESALLAGIINSPYWYDPMNFLDYSTSRRNQVLAMMLRHGYITEQEYNLASAIQVEDLLYDHSVDQPDGNINPYQPYIDQAIIEAEQITGQDPYTVAMDLYTAMDANAQVLSHQICAGQIDYIQYPSDQVEVGFLTIDNNTGEIIAIGGGRNYAAGGTMLLNHATQALHNPGSTVKPFFSYALAFEHLGWATSHVVTDKPVGDSTWVFSNFDGVYRGDVTLEYAIQVSLNTPAIQALYDEINTIGWSGVTSYISSLGFSQYSEDTFDVSWAIGSNQFLTNPEEIAAATSMLFHQGQYTKPHVLRNITFRSGFQDPVNINELEQFQAKQVLSPQAAYLSAYMMNRVVNSSEYNYAQVLRRNYQTFAKSGTSDYGNAGLVYGIPEGARKDKWMVSATTEYTTACWLGFDKASADYQSYFSDYWDSMNTNGLICSAILDGLYAERSEPADLVQPEGISSITHIKGLFPYVSTIENMDSQYITTGMVKSEYASLGSPASADSISEISSFDAHMADDDNTIAFTWAAYPDAEKLKTAEKTKDISLKSGNTVLKGASGTRMFDYSWVYGAIRYKATVSQYGNVIATVTSENDSMNQAIDGLAYETETTVCGYYGYDSIGGDSPAQACSTFTTPEAKFTLPTSGTYESISSWLSNNGLTVSIINEVHTDGSGSVGSVSITDANGNSITGQNVARSVFAGATVTVIAD